MAQRHLSGPGLPRLLRGGLSAIVALALFVVSWFSRFNDPSGSFAGLTDDHFFYVVRGWQILYGDLPVRDFVDHGAPLHFYVAAWVQQWFGRGTLSEIAFAVTVLSASAVLTFWLAARASGSIVCGAAGAIVQILLAPRFYNYPKILVYAVAIPLLWRVADRPRLRAAFWVAVVTAIGFLFRHDHGVFVGAAFAGLLLALRELGWVERCRIGVGYAAMVAVLLAPYLVFIQLNGGLDTYFRDALSWAEHDRERAPFVWPTLVEGGAATTDGSRSPLGRAVSTVRENFDAWMFYLEVALPFLSLAVLAVSRDGFRSDWPRAAPKLIAVAVLAILLNAGFLRKPLEARLADPSVPLAILLAWLFAAAARALPWRRSFAEALRVPAAPVRALVLAAAIVAAFVLYAGLGTTASVRLSKAGLLEPPADMMQRARRVREDLRDRWRLEWWRDQSDRPELLELSLYLDACTGPSDRVFMQHYAPQVLAMARRAFAGGHADLRPGFFETRDSQQRTIERLRAQRVPVVLLEPGAGDSSFRGAFPLIARYFDDHYSVAGTHLFDKRFNVQLLVRNGTARAGTYRLLGWPCLRRGTSDGAP